MPLDLVLIFGIKALATMIAVGAVVALLTFRMVVNWFRNRAALKERDKNNVAFTLQERLSNGNVKTVQGIFNTRSNTLLDSTGYQSADIDSELADIHSGQEVVIYT